MNMSQPILNKYPHMKLGNLKSHQDIEEDNIKERVVDAKFDIIILRELKLLEDKEMVSLYKMIKSNDKENLVVAEEIIKQLFDKYKP